MEYWVAMQEGELKTALALLGKPGLPGIVTVQEDDGLSRDSILEQMVQKKFLREGSDGKEWNPFVRVVLTDAANADSELQIEGKDGFRCRLYFCDRDMILLDWDAKAELFVFYYVPLLPKAIGGLAKVLEPLEREMGTAAKGSELRFPAGNAAETAAALTDALIALEEFRGKNPEVLLTAEGWSFSQCDLVRALLRTEDGFCLAWQEDGEFRLMPVEYYSFLQELSRWIVRTHGKSLRKAGVEDGTDQG